VALQDFKVTVVSGSITDAAPTVVTPVSGSVYTVTISTGSGTLDGHLRLDEIYNPSNPPISDGSGNTLNSSFTTGEVYDVEKPPAVQSIALVGSNPTNATSLPFTVTFSEPVTGVEVADFAAVTTGTINNPMVASVTAVSGSGGSAWTVTVTTGVSGDGTVGLNIPAQQATTIQDLSGNALPSTGFTGDVYTIDQPPTVNSITRADPNPQLPGATLHYTVTFSKDVQPNTVNTNDFGLTTTGGISNPSIVQVSEVSASVYTVTVSSGSGEGTARLDVLTTATIQDTLGTSMAPTGFTGGQSYTLDQPPTVNSIVTAAHNPTNAFSLPFTVKFSKPVTLGAHPTADFVVTAGGGASGQVTSVSGNGSVYTVTVTAGSGDGTIRLDVAVNNTIQDLAGNPMSGGFFGGQSYTVDHTPPTVVSMDTGSPSPSSSAINSVTITFSEAVQGVTLADLQLLQGSSSTNLLTGSQATLTPSNGGITWTLGNLGALTNPAHRAVSFTLTLSPAGITDLAGNPLGSGSTTPPFVVADAALNLNLQQHTVSLQGTQSNDTFLFTAGTSLVATLNGITYTIDPTVANNVQFFGMGGSDTATLVGTGTGETANLGPTTGTLSSNNSAYAVTVFFSPMSGALDVLKVQGGPSEVAYLNGNGAVGNNTFVATPTTSYMTTPASSTSPGYWDQVYGFGAVVATSTGQGNNRATLYDATGGNLFSAQPTTAQLTGSGLWEQANGFQVVIASSAGKGNDRAYLSGGGTFVGAPTYAYLNSGNSWNQASNFDVVIASGATSGDRATFLDSGSAGNDAFIATPGSTYMSGSTSKPYWNQVYNFRVVIATDSGPGNARAYLYGSALNDTFVGTPATSYLSTANGYWEQTYGFKVVLAVGGGGNDSAQLSDSAGNNTFVGQVGNSYMSGNGFWNQVFGFATVMAVASAGSNDVATLYGSLGNDAFVGQGPTAYLSAAGSLNWTTGFKSVTAVSNGGTDVADLTSLDFIFSEVGNWINHQH
jgi:hypothetical protein